MSGRDAASPAALGFLTVIEDEQIGLVGGYLLLNLSGRPLEFHCTAPVKPNRAQQILYGPTLEPYLYGDQIGVALTSKCGIQPLCIFTDRQPALALGDHVPQPVVWVGPGLSASSEDVPQSDERDRAPAALRLDAAHDAPRGLTTLRFGGATLGWRGGRGERAEELRQRLDPVDPDFDLSEPFGRIREAIEEAQRGSR